jgi:hypothetical protein
LSPDPAGLDPGAPPEYLVGHIEDALARDPRVTEQGLRVQVRGSPPTVVVTGTVVSQRHQAAIAEIVAELLPGARLDDETTVADYPEPSEVEELP